MNVVPGSSFFQTVSGSAARPETARPPQGGRIFEAQSVDSAPRTAPAERADAPTRAANPYGPRGNLVDIIA